ncbi:MAG: hypothetical protein ACPL0A_00830 [Candidatus Micrarchaeia archaeon]
MFADGVRKTVSEMLSSDFNKMLLAVVVVLGVIAYISSIVSPPETSTDKLVIYLFTEPGCPYCAQQKPIIYELEKEMSDKIVVVEYDVITPQGSAMFYQLAAGAGLDVSKLAVPTTIIGNKAIVGMHDKEFIRNEILDCLNNCKSKTVASEKDIQKSDINVEEYELPFLGKTNLTEMSLPMLAIVMGLTDGFNPCAMWVLVYLISLLLNVNDKKKFWIIIGSFIFASFTLYFLFMTAWLHLFLLIGYIRILTIIIGMFALWMGMFSIKEYVETKGELVCKVGGVEEKRKTAGKISEIVSQPINLSIIFSIVVLAFVINSVEFACSSALPAIFTYVLSTTNISIIERYLYILLYDVFYMIDDAAIFIIAGLAIGSSIGEKYAKYCKLIGGVIMVVLGMIMLFAPHMLR